MLLFLVPPPHPQLMQDFSKYTRGTSQTTRNRPPGSPAGVGQGKRVAFTLGEVGVDGFLVCFLMQFHSPTRGFNSSGFPFTNRIFYFFKFPPQRQVLRWAGLDVGTPRVPGCTGGERNQLLMKPARLKSCQARHLQPLARGGGGRRGFHAFFPF